MNSEDEQKSHLSEQSRQDLEISKQVSDRISRELSRQNLEAALSESRSNRPLSDTSKEDTASKASAVDETAKKQSPTKPYKRQEDKGSIVDPNAPLFQVKADERIANVFSEKATFTPTVFNASEIDLFAMENRARAKIHELILPVQERMDVEQKQRAEMAVTYDRVLNRLEKLENLLGMSEGKPAIAVELEGAMSELRKWTTQSCNETRIATERLSAEQERVNNQIGEIRSIVSTVEKGLDRREATLNALDAENKKQKQDLATTFETMQKRIADISADLVKECGIFGERLAGTMGRLKTLEVNQGQIQIQVAQLCEDNETCMNKLEEFSQRKIDIDDFNKALMAKQEQWEATRLSCKDNFLQLVATDNYIDKYLPMRIQFQIGESLKSFLNHLPTGDKPKAHKKERRNSFVKDQIVESEAMRKFNEFEADVYYRMHRLVMDDQGEHTLAKRGVLKPGSLRVLTDDERRLLFKQVTERMNDESDEDDVGGSMGAGSPQLKLDSEFDSPPDIASRSRGPSAASRVIRPQQVATVPSRMVTRQSLGRISSAGKTPAQGVSAAASSHHPDIAIEGSVRSVTQPNTEVGVTQAGSEASPKRNLKKNYSAMIGESLEKMRLELEVQTAKIREQLLEEVVKVRTETRDALEKQLAFIEESYVDTKVNHQTNQRALRRHEAKVRSIDDFVQSLVLNNNGQNMSGHQTIYSQNRDSAMSSMSEAPMADEPANLSSKKPIEWLLDAARLQNILNQHLMEHCESTDSKIKMLAEKLQGALSAERAGTTRMSPEPRRRQVMTKQSDSQHGGRVTDPSIVAPSLDQMAKRESSAEALSNLEHAHHASTKLGFVGDSTTAKGIVSETPALTVADSLVQGSMGPAKAQQAKPKLENRRESDTLSPPEHISGSKMPNQDVVSKTIKMKEPETRGSSGPKQALLAVSDSDATKQVAPSEIRGRYAQIASSAETADDLKLYQAGESLTPTLNAQEGTLTRGSPTIKQGANLQQAKMPMPQLVINGKGEESKSDTVSRTHPAESPLLPVTHISHHVAEGATRASVRNVQSELQDTTQLVQLIDRILVHCQRVQSVQKTNQPQKATKMSHGARRVSTAATQKRSEYPMSTGGPRGVRSIFSNRTIQQGSSDARPAAQSRLDNSIHDTLGTGLQVPVNRTIMAAPRHHRLKQYPGPQGSSGQFVANGVRLNPDFYQYGGQSLLNTLTPTSQVDLQGGNHAPGMSVLSGTAAGTSLLSDRPKVQPKVRVIRSKQGMQDTTLDYIVQEDQGVPSRFNQQNTTAYLLNQTGVMSVADGAEGLLTPMQLDSGSRQGNGTVGAVGPRSLQGHLRRQLKSAAVKKQ